MSCVFFLLLFTLLGTGVHTVGYMNKNVYMALRTISQLLGSTKSIIINFSETNEQYYKHLI